MTDIVDPVTKKKLATLGDDNKIRTAQGAVIGQVVNDSQVWDFEREVGSVDGKGYVYEAGRHIGSVIPDGSDGKVVDYNLRPVGKVKGGNLNCAGAAFLLLMKEDLDKKVEEATEK